MLFYRQLWLHDGMTGNDVDKRVVLRDHQRPVPITQTLRRLRRMVKSSENTLRRKMSTFEGGQFVLLVKALRQTRSGQVHGTFFCSLTHDVPCIESLFVRLTVGPLFSGRRGRGGGGVAGLEGVSRGTPG